MIRRTSASFVFAVLALLGAAPAGRAAAAAPAPRPSPTPTPRPRLSGGFGRTPVPSATRAEPAPVPPAATAAPAAEGESPEAAAPAVTPRKEPAPPKEKAPKAVAITNENLVKDPNRGRVSTSTVRLPTPPAATPVPGVKPLETPAAAAAPLSSAGDEAVWRERARTARRRVEELKAEITQLEADAKQLETDFYRWDDGQYRDRVIKPSWDKKREELETKRRQLVDAETELADLPEKARKAGALPGWLRE
jgi:hypothetical protein